MKEILAIAIIGFSFVCFGQSNAQLKAQRDKLRANYDVTRGKWEQVNDAHIYIKYLCKDQLDKYMKNAGRCEAELALIKKTVTKLNENAKPISDSVAIIASLLISKKVELYSECRRKKKMINQYPSFSYVINSGDADFPSSMVVAEALRKQIREYQSAAKRNTDTLMTIQNWSQSLDSLSLLLMENNAWLEKMYPKLEVYLHDLNVLAARLEPIDTSQHLSLDKAVIATENPISNENPTIFQFADISASFPGGKEGLDQYYKDNLIIPSITLEPTQGGVCYLSFVVSERGNISNVRIVRGIVDCKECDIEAVRVLRTMPNWIPGEVNGKRINMYYNLGIPFMIDSK